MARRALIALALAGCIADPRAGLDDDPDAIVGADARVAPDARVDQPGDASPPADAEASPDAGSTNCAVDVAYFPTEGFERYEPVVAGGAVYGHRYGPERQLRAVRLDDDTPAGGPSDLLADADGRALLLLRPDGAGAMRLIYRADGGPDVPLGEAGFIGVQGLDDFQPRHLVREGAAAWVDADAIWAWWGDEPAPRWLGPAHGVAVGADLLAWIHPLDGQVHAAPRGQEERAIGPAEGTTAVVPTAAGVWWLSGGHVYLWPTGHPGPGRTLGDLARCEALDAEGDHALATCLADDDTMVAWRLTVDGAKEAVHRATRIVAPRAGAGGLAWASYDDPQAWCANATEGELWWWPAGEAAALRVSPVGSGCLCCGAYWPALQVDLGADVLAWSYGRGREAPAIGVARRRCE
ncbi:MAG: hypothetical protein H6706_20175 [Myxococcales bacterium]|nr:hypothetical protein [Myxococcales bacterium]